jgi:hypothetical protein
MMRRARCQISLRRYILADSAIWAHPAPSGSVLLIKDGATFGLWQFD